MFSPTILFVDDESNVLQGIRRVLHHKRDTWRLEFAANGKGALAVMATMPVDVLVSDMRMPEMDGAALLAEAARLHPDTVRFILSGQSDKEAMFRAVGPCHGYLLKPCDGTVLQSSIETALALRWRLANPSLRRVVGRLSIVPALPAAYRELQVELEAAQPRPERIEMILASNPGFAAKLLQIANSAYFQRAGQIRSLARAVDFLGYDMVRTLLLSFALEGQLQRREVGGIPVEELIGHGLTTAVLARLIARSERLGPTVLENCFTAGVLHDIGILVLAENFGDLYGSLVAAARRSGRLLHEAEREAFGVTHADVGAYLLGWWGLPDQIVQAIADHHDAAGRSDALDASAVLRAANELVNQRDIDVATDLPEERSSRWRGLRDQTIQMHM